MIKDPGVVTSESHEVSMAVAIIEYDISFLLDFLDLRSVFVYCLALP